MALKRPQYEILPAEGGEFYWRLKARNGEIVAVSETYETRAGAEEGAKAARRASRTARIMQGKDPRDPTQVGC